MFKMSDMNEKKKHKNTDSYQHFFPSLFKHVYVNWYKND